MYSCGLIWIDTHIKLNNCFLKLGCTFQTELRNLFMTKGFLHIYLIIFLCILKTVCVIYFPDFLISSNQRVWWLSLLFLWEGKWTLFTWELYHEYNSRKRKQHHLTDKIQTPAKSKIKIEKKDKEKESNRGKNDKIYQQHGNESVVELNSNNKEGKVVWNIYTRKIYGYWSNKLIK